MRDGSGSRHGEAPVGERADGRGAAIGARRGGSSASHHEVSGTVHGAVVQSGPVYGDIVVREEHPGHTPAPVPRQVPAGAAFFQDRAVVLAQLDRWAALPDAGPSGAWMAALSGPPGVGKSETVRHWVQRQRGRFPDGELYIDFQELRERVGGDVSAGVSRCLRSLGVKDEHLPADLQELTNLYRSHTADRQLLVVLDNVTAPSQVKPLVPQSSGSALLVTSNGRLGELALDGARLVPLEPLGEEDGRRLLEEMCSAERIAADPQAADRIVERCGGLPVALRVAAARLATHPWLSPAALEEELADERRRLDALRVGGERTVTAVFGVAYEGLPPEAARLYRILGLCPTRHWDVQLAAAVAELPAQRARELLETLADASLVTGAADGTRFTFHELIRLHARDRAEREESPAEQQGAVRRAVDHLLLLSAHADLAVTGERLRVPGDAVELVRQQEPAFAAKEAALDWLESWRADLLAAQRAAAECGMHRQTWQLATALTALFLNRRYVTDWEESGERGANAAAAEGDSAAEARVRTMLSRPLLDRGERERAKWELETAIARADASGEPLLRASAREFYGRWYDQYEPAGALAVYRAMLELYEVAADARGTAIGLYFLGQAEDTAGEHGRGLATLQDALQRFLDLPEPDRRMAARTRVAIGTAKHRQGCDTQAAAWLEEAVRELLAVGATHYEAPARERLALLALERGEYGARSRHLERALEIYQHGGSPHTARVRRELEESEAHRAAGEGAPEEPADPGRAEGS